MLFFDDEHCSACGFISSSESSRRRWFVIPSVLVGIRMKPNFLFINLVLVFSVAAAARAADRQTLNGHVPVAVANFHLQPVGRLPAQERLSLLIGLPMRNQEQFKSLLEQMYDPASPQYHRYLTPQEIAERFGPAEEDYQAVLAFVETNDLHVSSTHVDRTLLRVDGTVAAIEKTFHVTLRTYPHPIEARTFYAPDVEPSFDLAVPLLHISGLDNYIVPRPAGHFGIPLKQGSDGAPASGSGPGGAYRGNDFRAAYVPGTSLNGAGQSIGLLELDGYYSNDIQTYEAAASLPNVPLTNILIDGFSGLPDGNANWVGEVSLDIEVAIAMAPGISQVRVYEAPNCCGYWVDILKRMQQENIAKQLSCSWLFNSDDPNADTVYQQFAMQGQSFFQCSGDYLAFYNGVSQWTDDPNVTLVGGTMLTTTGPGGSWVSETTWNNGNGINGSGGGISGSYMGNFSIPTWQQGISMTTNFGSTTKRNVPDVSLFAYNAWVVWNNGSTGGWWGTSIAAPLWAGFTALINQQAVAAGKPMVGFLNPALYAIGKGATYTNCFHDIVTGNNTNSQSSGLYPAVAGYDLCTGLGTPNGTNLINTLVPPVFVIAITNTGWSLVFESATPTNGLIDPGETVTVSFTLQNQGALPSSNLVATLQPNAGVLAPSGPQTYGALAAFGGSTNKPFTFTAAGTCGSSIVATLQLQDGGNNLGTVSITLPLGGISVNPSQTFAENFDGITAPALPAQWLATNVSGTANPWATTTASANTPPNSAFVTDSASAGQNALVSPVIPITGSNAQLSCRQSYSFGYTNVVSGGHGHPTTNTVFNDGGVLEVQIGNGAFSDILSAGGSFVSGGYNGVLTTTSGNPLGGRSAWVGSSNVWQTVTVRLPPAAAGQNIQVRWNCATDTGNTGSGAVGWYVDSVSVTDVVRICLPVLTDLAPSQTIATNSLSIGQNLIYTLSITNLGPQTAANVMLTDTVPANVTFVSASPGCSYSAGQVVCPVGMLAPTALTNFTVMLSPTAGNVFTNLVSVGTVTPETSSANNTSTLITTQSAGGLPPGLTGSVTNRTLQCGSNTVTFFVTASGTPPFAYQWSLDSVAAAGATNATYSLTNLHLPNHTVAITVTNLYGGVTSNALLTVVDTLVPVITLNGGSPLYIGLGGTFTDPGATAYDLCAGVVPVSGSGSVNLNVEGTNTLTYTAGDGNGNTNTTVRLVIVRDATPIIRSVASSTNGSFTLDLSGAPGFTYILESASDLAVPVGWQPVATNTLDATGDWQYNDMQATNFPQRFYRLMLAP